MRSTGHRGGGLHVTDHTTPCFYGIETLFLYPLPLSALLSAHGTGYISHSCSQQLCEETEAQKSAGTQGSRNQRKSVMWWNITELRGCGQWNKAQSDLCPFPPALLPALCLPSTSWAVLCASGGHTSPLQSSETRHESSRQAWHPYMAQDHGNSSQSSKLLGRSLLYVNQFSTHEEGTNTSGWD